MPWQTESVMSQRLEFVRAVLHRAPGTSIRDVCRSCGITEQTGHKWLTRFGAGGPAALADRSHAPHAPAHQVAPPLVSVKMPVELVALWPSGLVTVTVRVPAVAPPLTETLSVTCVGSV